MAPASNLRRLLCATALALVAVGDAAPTDAAVGLSTAEPCISLFDALTVVSVCDGHLGVDFRLSSGKDRRFQAGPAVDTARLRGVELAPGDRVLVTGTASARTALVALDVKPSGSATANRFQALGLEAGGRASLVVTAEAGRRVFRLLRPDGTTIPPRSVTFVRGRRYITGLLVRGLAGKVAVTFTAASDTTEVALLGRAATQEMLLTGELEDPFLVVKTISTRTGRPVQVTLPSRSTARFVYVKPLAPSLVLPALAPLP